MCLKGVEFNIDDDACVNTYILTNIYIYIYIYIHVSTALSIFFDVDESKENNRRCRPLGFVSIFRNLDDYRKRLVFASMIDICLRVDTFSMDATHMFIRRKKCMFDVVNG
jgi:hypothetical protein